MRIEGAPPCGAARLPPSLASLRDAGGGTHPVDGRSPIHGCPGSPLGALWRALCAAALALGTLPAAAQAPAAGQGGAPVLTSPVPSGTAQPGAAGLPQGTGAGYHSPQSPIKPLPQREDVLPWSTLTQLEKKTTKTRVVPQFNAEQQALHGTVQRVQGFMVPLDAKELQVHFLLTTVPLTCSFCIPGGPESMIEVRAKLPVRYGLEPVVVQGRLQLLKDDPYGLFYRLVDAVPIK
jgi:hypothetical protein